MGRISRSHEARAHRLAKEAALERARARFAACLESLDYNDHYIELAVVHADESPAEARKAYFDKGLSKGELARLARLAGAVKAAHDEWQEARA